MNKITSVKGKTWGNRVEGKEERAKALKRAHCNYPAHSCTSLFSPFGSLFYLEDGGSRLLQNVCTHLPNYI
jgi:hypothetical protein